MAVAKPKLRARTPKGPTPKPKRKLVRWSDSMDKRLLLAIQYVANERAIVLPWDTIGEHLDVTPGAISQHLAKLRHRLVDWGFTVPPPLRRGGNNAVQGPKSRAKVGRRSSTRKGYESDGYENEEDEEPDWKEEEEYGEEESDTPATEVRAIKKGGRKVAAKENGESEEDVKPRVRLQLRLRNSRKPAPTVKSEDDESYASPIGTGEESRPHKRFRAEAGTMPQEPGDNRISRVLSSEGSFTSDVEMGDVGGGNGPRKRADIQEMFSEFSRPTEPREAGPPNTTGIPVDRTYGRFRQRQASRSNLGRNGNNPYDEQNNAELRGGFPMGAEESCFVGQESRNPYKACGNLEESNGLFDQQDDDDNSYHMRSGLHPGSMFSQGGRGRLSAEQDDNPYNGWDNLERDDRLTKEAETVRSANHAQNRTALVQQVLGVSTPAHVTSTPSTPKNKILRNPYANDTTPPYGESSIHSDGGQYIAPMTEMSMQYQRMAGGAVPGFLDQPGNAFLSEPLYPALDPYSQFGAFGSSRNEFIEPRQGPRHDSRSTPSSQPRPGHRQHSGLRISREDMRDPFSSPDFIDYDSFIQSDGLGDTIGGFGDMF
ncbi:MAG: hypothetical protein M1839_009201 [Geoglossum umbratile]|nr:MAG: hypothetical protein M1839_009201 [Geoglossum umbratile]